MEKTKEITLFGRVLITANVQAVTGLHIGKGREGLTIGGVDNAVMRDSLTNEPYIPGSSLKGKMRSLAEKREPTAIQNQPMGKDVMIHICSTRASYDKCPVCRVYGVPGQKESSAPTRLVVRDVFLTDESRQRLRGADTDLPFTEIKYEAAIDRVTSAANPRPLERVPANSVFGPLEMVFSIYDREDVDLLKKILEAMRLLEDDYLGGSGSRGSGKVRFEDLQVIAKPVDKYLELAPALEKVEADDLDALLGKIEDIMTMIKKEIQVPADTEEPDKEQSNG